MERRSNLIIICPDEMRGDCAGFMGNSDIRTPQMDSLAGESVVFQHHCASFAKCVPARIALMTGRFSHTDGYRDITHHMDPAQPNLLDRFREHAYQTAVFGKNHCWDKQVFEEKIDFTSHKAPSNALLKNRPQLNECSPPSGYAQPLELEDGWQYTGRNTRHAADEVYTAQAIEFLNTYRDPQRPFFLQLNIESPHPVYGVEEPYFSLYDRQKIEAWPHSLPPNSSYPLRMQRVVRTGLQDNPVAARELQAVYYGMITKVDVLVGQVMAAVREAGLWEDTIVMLWSDHGDWAGQFCLAEKWDTCFNECLIHVPFTMRIPGHSARRIDSLTQHTDIAPTLCELLGFDPLPGMHGESLVPVIEGKETRTIAFCEGGHEKQMRQRAAASYHESAAKQPEGTRRFAKTQTYQRYPEAMARAKMVRDTRYKIIIRETGENELYDLQSDPWEQDNRWDDRSLIEVKCRLMEQMAQWSLKTDTDRPKPESVVV